MAGALDLQHDAAALEVAHPLFQLRPAAGALINPQPVFPIHPCVGRFLSHVADQCPHQARVQEGVFVFEAPAPLGLVPAAGQLVGGGSFVHQQVGGEVFRFEPVTEIGLPMLENNPAGFHQAEEEPLVLLAVIAPDRHRQQ